MGERFRTRALVVRRALASRMAPTRRGAGAKRILVAHNLLLGDLLMLTPLLKKLRERQPEAHIAVLARPAFASLYGSRPYGARALPFDPRRSDTSGQLLREPPFDEAIVVGDNRYSWLAAAAGARRIVAHAGERAWTRNWLVDEHRPYPPQPAAWSDIVAGLVDGPEPAPYARGEWAAPEAQPFDAPSGRYAVLHVGASTPLKRWPPARWQALAAELVRRDLEPVWSAGPGEEALAAACDPERRHRSFAGALDLPQMWRLLAGATLLVAPDTGVAHLGRVTWTPTVALFGPGSATLCASGRFWHATPWHAVGEQAFPCRDQTILFGRDIPWVRRCGRSTRECGAPRCMEAIGLAPVLEAIDALPGT